jgi:GDPmannose 4,6-dehydratase
MHKIALLTGITGQDGSYLAELLLEKGYTVHGVVGRSSSFATGRFGKGVESGTEMRLHLHYGDLGDACPISRRLVSGHFTT